MERLQPDQRFELVWMRGFYTCFHKYSQTSGMAGCAYLKRREHMGLFLLCSIGQLKYGTSSHLIVKYYGKKLPVSVKFGATIPIWVYG